MCSRPFSYSGCRDQDYYLKKKIDAFSRISSTTWVKEVLLKLMMLESQQ